MSLNGRQKKQLDKIKAKLAPRISADPRYPVSPDQEDPPPAPPPEEPELKPYPRYTAAELVQRHPKLPPPVVEGLLREGETGNLNGDPKIGKSWGGYGLLFSVVTGRPWLDRFPTRQGKCLLIDNELNEATLAHRLKTVADKMDISLKDLGDALTVLPLRGRLRDIHELAVDMADVRDVKLILLDARYRAMPQGASENDNAAMTDFFNRLDQYSQETGAAFVDIHHNSRGEQGSKKVTDVGAGAGAQSRAADTHMVLREHEETDVFVLEAVVRSFAPVEPLALRWEFPLWVPALDLDPSLLRGRLTKQEERQTDKDREGCEAIVNRLAKGPTPRRLLRDLGFSADRLDRLLGILQAAGKVAWTPIKIKGNDSREYFLTPS